MAARRQERPQALLGADQHDAQQLAGGLQGALDHDLGGVVAAQRVDRHAHDDAGLLRGHGGLDVVRGEDFGKGVLPAEVGDQAIEVDVGRRSRRR